MRGFEQSEATYNPHVTRILISGASGLIGAALLRVLEEQGNELFRLVRRKPRAAREICWEPMRAIPPQLVSGFEAVIHLSGESDSLPEPGTPIELDGRTVGFLGTALHHFDLGPIALAVVKRTLGADVSPSITGQPVRIDIA